MKKLRRALGIFVMAAGIIGLLLSLSGLAGLFIIRSSVTTSIERAVSTLHTSVESSRKTLALTDEALDAAIDSVDALAEMLSTSRQIVEDTQPVVSQVNEVLGENLPGTFDAAGDSLKAAQGAARSLESAIKSIETFQSLISGVLVFSGVQPQEQAVYDPDTSLADSLGNLSKSIEDLPSVFKDMSKDLSKADDNLDHVKTSLDDMSKNISRISKDLEQYRGMLADSRSSMDDLMTLLSDLQKNLPAIMTTITLIFGLFFLWLLAAQVVIFSQGWELYHGTAGRMEGGPAVPQPAVVEPAVVEMEALTTGADKPSAAAKPRAKRVKKNQD